MATTDLAVPSAVYPGLERKPGGPDNWVEKAGGLPPYIERIAKHLHYERGFTISHAIATAVNTVKRWARGGFVTKTGTIERVSPATQAKAAAAVASWEAKKGSGGLSLSARLSPEEALMNGIVDLAHRANAIDDPERRAAARRRVLDLATNGFQGLPPLDPKEIDGDDADDDQPDATSTLKAWIENLEVDQSVKDEGLRLLGEVGKNDPEDTDLSNTYEQQGGGFPIPDVEHLKKAIQAFGRSKDPAKTKRHIISRARALGRTDLIPTQWAIDLAIAAVDTGMGEIVDLANLASSRNKKWTPRKKGGFASPKGGGGKTSDGRPSYKRQGRWGHGFKPLDQAARESKAKGSPVAMKRVSRLFGGGKASVIKAKDGGTERVSRLAQALRPKIADSHESQRLKIKSVANRPTVSRRSDKAWDEIADDDKVIRNGKRYVLTTYNGKNQLTEWVGPKPDAPQAKPWMRRFASVTATTLEQYTAGQLRQMLEVPGQPAAVRKAIYAMIEKKQKEARERG